MRFYRVVLNPKAGDIWFPDAPETDGGEEVDPRAFCECARWEGHSTLVVPTPQGSPGRFAFGEFDYPLVDAGVAAVVADRDAAVQRVPVSIAGPQGSYVVLNVLRSVECIDENASEFDRFELVGSRPDLAGQYRTFYRLRLQPTVVPDGAHIFRIYGYEVALIVSEAMKELLEQERADDGIAFVTVT